MTAELKTLVVYSKTNCPACVLLKSRLQREGREFTEVNVDKDPDARSFLLSKGHRSVPVVYEDGVHISM